MSERIRGSYDGALYKSTYILAYYYGPRPLVQVEQRSGVCIVPVCPAAVRTHRQRRVHQTVVKCVIDFYHAGRV